MIPWTLFDGPPWSLFCRRSLLQSLRSPRWLSFSPASLSLSLSFGSSPRPLSTPDSSLGLSFLRLPSSPCSLRGVSISSIFLLCKLQATAIHLSPDRTLFSYHIGALYKSNAIDFKQENKATYRSQDYEPIGSLSRFRFLGLSLYIQELSLRFTYTPLSRSVLFAFSYHTRRPVLFRRIKFCFFRTSIRLPSVLSFPAYITN